METPVMKTAPLDLSRFVATKQEMELLVRNTCKDIIPIKVAVHKEKARAITEEERKYSAFNALRQARAHARLAGKRAKRLKELEQEKKWMDTWIYLDK